MKTLSISRSLFYYTPYRNNNRLIFTVPPARLTADKLSEIMPKPENVDKSGLPCKFLLGTTFNNNRQREIVINRKENQLRQVLLTPPVFETSS